MYGIASNEEDLDKMHISKINKTLNETADLYEKDNIGNLSEYHSDSDTDESYKVREEEYPPEITDKETAEEIELLGQEKLNLKDYSGTKTNNPNQFLKVIVGNKSKMVRKSSLCWLFSDKTGRLSNDRLLRVRGMSSTSNTGKTQQTTKKSILLKRNSLRKQTNRKQALKQSSSTSSESESDTGYSLRNSSDDELSFSDDGNDPGTSYFDIEEEKYYAVYYETSWYVGRIIKKNKEACQIKFLKEELDEFIWPKPDDVQDVEFKYVFFGPVDLSGNNPFKIKRADRLIINKMYKQLKQEINGTKKYLSFFFTQLADTRYLIEPG